MEAQLFLVISLCMHYCQLSFKQKHLLTTILYIVTIYVTTCQAVEQQGCGVRSTGYPIDADGPDRVDDALLAGRHLCFRLFPTTRLTQSLLEDYCRPFRLTFQARPLFLQFFSSPLHPGPPRATAGPGTDNSSGPSQNIM